MSDDAPDANAADRYRIPSADPQPAQVRPGTHVAPPVAVDEGWWDRLSLAMDLETLLAAARACHRARCHWEEPAWVEIGPRLAIAEAYLLDAVESHPASRVAKEYLRQVEWALGRRVRKS